MSGNTYHNMLGMRSLYINIVCSAKIVRGAKVVDGQDNNKIASSSELSVSTVYLPLMVVRILVHELGCTNLIFTFPLSWCLRMRLYSLQYYIWRVWLMIGVTMVWLPKNMDSFILTQSLLSCWLLDLIIRMLIYITKILHYCDKQDMSKLILVSSNVFLLWF